MSKKIAQIFVIDDDSAEFTRSSLSTLYPDAEIHAFDNLKDALKKLSATEAENRPDIIISDCSSDEGGDGYMGVYNGNILVKWYKKHTGALPDATMIFISKDINIAEEVSAEIFEKTGWPSMIANSMDFDRYEGIVRGKICDLKKADVENGVRTFLNETTGLNLPVTQDEVDAELLKNRQFKPKDIIRLTQAKKMDTEEALRLLRPPTFESLNENYTREADTYHPLEGVFMEDTETSFMEAIGDPVTGYAAYSLEDVKALAAKNKKAVLIVKDYSPGIIPHLGQIAGLVFISSHGTGHLKALLSSHRISAVFGMKQAKTEDDIEADNDLLDDDELDDESFDKAFDSDDNTNQVLFDGRIQIHRRLNPLNNNMVDLRRVIARQDELYPEHKDPDKDFDYSTMDRERVNNVYSSIEPYAAVTITTGRKKRLYGCRLPITDKSYLSERWLPDVGILLQQWKAANDVYTPLFKANIDHASQTKAAMEMSDGIGLMRTEHLVLGDAKQFAAYKSFLLQQDEASFEALMALQAKSFLRIFKAFDKDLPVKIRLMDAPPTEFFTPEEITQLEEKYGTENLRGVQLARQVPQLYEAQIRAIALALERYKAAPFKAEKPADYKNLLGILVPTVRTLMELKFVDHLLDDAARSGRLDRRDYSFGSMIETTEAHANIAHIADLCDFISIGSNDLTSEILECARDDWAKRRKLTIASGRQADPFVTLNEKVLSAIFNIASEARTTKANITVELCGDHAADEDSLVQLQPVKLDAVSMPPIAKNMRGLRIFSDYRIFEKHIN